MKKRKNKPPPETVEDLEDLAGEILSGLCAAVGIKIDRSVFVNVLGKNVRPGQKVRVEDFEFEYDSSKNKTPPKVEPPPAQKFNWRIVLGFEGTPLLEQVNARYRQLSKIYHKDAGGSDESMRILNLARAAAVEELAK